MKNVKFYIGIFGLSGFLFAACAKEEVTPDNGVSTNKYTKNKTDEVSDKIGGDKRPVLRVWYDNGTSAGDPNLDYGCRDFGGNCLPDIVVVPLVKADIRGIGEVIRHGNAPEIINEFKNKRHILEPLVGTSHVQGVINSALKPEVRGVDEETIYFVFSNKKNNKVLMVYPIR